MQGVMSLEPKIYTRYTSSLKQSLVSASKTGLNQATSFFYLGAWPSLVIIQVENQLQPMAGYRQTKFVTGHESAKERETHHKRNILMKIQIC